VCSWARTTAVYWSVWVSVIDWRQAAGLGAHLTLPSVAIVLSYHFIKSGEFFFKKKKNNK